MLLVNDVFQQENSRYRVLWRDEFKVYWINIDTEDALPESCEISNLNKQLKDGMLTPIEDPFQSFILSPPSQNEWGKEIQKKYWEMISSYVRNEPGIYDRLLRGNMVNEILQNHSTTKQTVYSKFRAFWQRGKNPRALFPNTQRNGGPGKLKMRSQKKMGRPRTTSIGKGINITNEIANVFRAIIKSQYLTTDENTITYTYNKALVALGIDRENVTEEELAEAPTYEQFYHFLQKEISIVEKTKKRAGDIHYQKDLSPVLGTSTSQAYGPGSLYQIDATIGDVYLVSESDRTRIIGRPVIYVVIDVFSRLVTGIYVGLEGPSWVSAIMALANTMTDKVSYCAKHSITITHDIWPVVGKPEAILGDRGEMIGKTVEILSEALFIDISNTPAYRADWKGIVERHFKTLQLKFKPYVEGYVTGVISKKRAGPDYRLDATLTLADITKIIIYCVLEYNTTHPIKNYDSDADIPPELPNIPLHLWNWGIQHRTGKLRSVSEEMAIINLLPHTEASVTEQGIKLFGCFYSTAHAIKEGWFNRIDTGPKRVTVAYDPHICNSIYLRLDGKYDKFIVCDLTERSRQFRGLTFWDVWRINKVKRQANKYAELTKTKGELHLDYEIEQIIAQANAKKPDTSGLTNTERVRGIRENRTNEIAENRHNNTGLVPNQKKPLTNTSKESNVVFLSGESLEDFSIPDKLDELYGDDE